MVFGLKPSNGSIDGLIFNPDFYTNDVISTVTKIEIGRHQSLQKSTGFKKESHVIPSKTSNRKIIFRDFIVLTRITRLYFLCIK